MKLDLKYKIKILMAFICLVLTPITISLNMNKHDRSILNFGTSSMPYSSDPLDYDQYIHHYAFTSIMGTLVSSGKKGEIVSQLAESWMHDGNAQQWTFVIRDNLTYSNGDLITAKDFELNFKRVAYLKKISNSQSGVFENLNDFENISSIDSITGIKSEGRKLTLYFKNPMPDLLTKISFGFYSLAHPSLFNNKTGEWINKKIVISSGPYTVVKWNDTEYDVELRKNLSYVDYDSAVEKVHFENLINVKKASDLSNVDMIVADKSTLMVDESFEYIGSSEGFKIGYAECYGWNNPKSPMSNILIRKWLRYKFLEGLKKSNLPLTNSFFPPVMPGLKDFELNYVVSKPIETNFKIKTHTMSKSSKIIENNKKLSIQEIIENGLKSMSNDSQIVIEQSDYNDSIEIEKQFDIAVNGTGIEADDFVSTARFMFLSKQGINLPDQSGKILSELEKEIPNMDLINKEIWDQAIIWPIRHYTKGYWFKRKSLINFDNLNLDLPAVDFQFIKWK